MVRETKILAAMKQVATEAGRKILEIHDEGIQVKEKSSHTDLVTEADVLSQKIIKEQLTASASQMGIKPSDIGFMGEEDLNVNGKHKFIIDPLDGTTNYASGLDFWCVSIGYSEEDALAAGVVFDPVSQTCYSAVKNKGAFIERDGVVKQLTMQRKELKKCLLAAHINFEAYQELLDVYTKLIPQVKSPRILGSLTLELCYLARGTYDILINGNGYLWDYAAAGLIVRESGGELAEWSGKLWQPDFDNPRKPLKLVACHPGNLKEVLSFMKRIAFCSGSF